MHFAFLFFDIIVDCVKSLLHFSENATIYMKRFSFVKSLIRTK